MKANPWARRRARRALVQAMYQWQLNNTDTTQLEQEFGEGRALVKADKEFFRSTLRALTLGDEQVDELIEPLLDRKFAELDQVERALLRLGAYEMKHRIDIPFRVVIDEYVELAKLFGAEDSHKYINGVLDRLAFQLRTAETG